MKSEIEEKTLPDFVLDARVRFGLVQQGHIGTIKKMLKEGASWDEIANKIGWCREVLKEHYARYIEEGVR